MWDNGVEMRGEGEEAGRVGGRDAEGLEMAFIAAMEKRRCSHPASSSFTATTSDMSPANRMCVVLRWNGASYVNGEICLGKPDENKGKRTNQIEPSINHTTTLHIVPVEDSEELERLWRRMCENQ